MCHVTQHMSCKVLQCKGSLAMLGKMIFGSTLETRTIFYALVENMVKENRSRLPIAVLLTTLICSHITATNLFISILRLQNLMSWGV